MDGTLPSEVVQAFKRCQKAMDPNSIQVCFMAWLGSTGPTKVVIDWCLLGDHFGALHGLHDGIFQQCYWAQVVQTCTEVNVHRLVLIYSWKSHRGAGRN